MKVIWVVDGRGSISTWADAPEDTRGQRTGTNGVAAAQRRALRPRNAAVRVRIRSVLPHMPPTSGRRRPLACAAAALGLVAQVMAPAAALAAPVLASADARIRIESPTACSVELAVTIEGASQVEHRVEAVEGSRVELLQVSGAVQG